MMKNSHSDNIYEKLREHLDRLPVGFSKTESGVEIDILKKFLSSRKLSLPYTSSRSLRQLRISAKEQVY